MLTNYTFDKLIVDSKIDLNKMEEKIQENFTMQPNSFKTNSSEPTKFVNVIS